MSKAFAPTGTKVSRKMTPTSMGEMIETACAARIAGANLAALLRPFDESA